MKLKIEKKGHTVVWNVNADCRRAIKPIAAEFGMTLEEFLKRYSAQSLPAQITPRHSKEEYKFKKGTGVKFACDDPALMSRIQRAAAFGERSLPEFIMQAIMGAVECDEDDMIMNPKTGEPFADDGCVDQFCCFEFREAKAA
jgi:hypothetical protein